MNLSKPLSRDTVKLLAVAAMACNHAAHALLPAGSGAAELLTDIGYFTAVTMWYFLVEGFRYTRSRPGMPCAWDCLRWSPSWCTGWHWGLPSGTCSSRCCCVF